MLDSSPASPARPTFADITTIGVGGSIAAFACPKDRVGLIEAVEGADAQGQPLCVIGGGSNLLVSDDPFPGLVVRDARHEMYVLDEAAPVEGQDRSVHVGATAGTNWDDLVDYCVRMGLAGIEGLSGIPGTVGASVVQNIGAYGQEVAQSVQSVEVWDRERKTTQELSAQDLAFGYRSSALKSSMYEAPGQPAESFFPTPRFVVLSVTFALRHSRASRVDFDQLARALGVEVGDQMPTEQIRQAVLSIRAQKGMLEDPYRYLNPWMRGSRQRDNAQAAIDSLQAAVDQAGGVDSPQGQDLIANRHSCGSFFMNPVISEEQAVSLPAEAPRFPVISAGQQADPARVKTSAAWLIDHAGFHKSFALPKAQAGLSTVHTLALTNRGSASSQELADLAFAIRSGVEAAFGLSLIPEPVLVGLQLDR
ncbi:UDP-N-acetylenolpyruvoylglucosamine reductase [Bombiscardovia apis]|uniref:UDP-N-acetylenolpyruvoylglucosamine reductase n=1 Tax=Bombiscardovia apis TaxID=2932182 RepID=A0ABM8BE34_9BIFI|nr:FAD-binding protein [Bombiscardovia apis]BDR55176.1 UDP-N-acetylenolpyruvoylglucosamine reductase [Bombiscardovia apis]